MRRDAEPATLKFVYSWLGELWFGSPTVASRRPGARAPYGGQEAATALRASTEVTAFSFGPATYPNELLQSAVELLDAPASVGGITGPAGRYGRAAREVSEPPDAPRGSRYACTRFSAA